MIFTHIIFCWNLLNNSSNPRILVAGFRGFEASVSCWVGSKMLISSERQNSSLGWTSLIDVLLWPCVSGVVRVATAVFSSFEDEKR